tara:strand:+ start:4561 stop:6807 length:2247 start_codon:yes stop_codon:yes gene_type:complete
MKPTQANPNKLKTSGVTNSVSFGIKSTGIAHIFNVLRNQLYSDKVRAVIREYSTNAMDAHIEAGKPDEPIEVTFPNTLSPFFKVRDFGLALTDDDIADIYAFYGESTKRNTNEQTGMLGIGSKSAFAYGDNFVINSYVKGKKHVYNAFIDPSQVGQISKLHAEDTEEPDGIEIVIPVNLEDVSEFAETGKDLFQWFKIKPVIKGVMEFEYDKNTPLFSGESWDWVDDPSDRRYGYSQRETMAVMGNIAYPVTYSDLQLTTEDADAGLSDLLTGSLVMRFNIGDLEISASREKLQMTDFTRKNLKDKLRLVSKELGEVVAKDFKSCKTLFDAKCLHGQVFDYSTGLYGLRQVLAPMMLWKGKALDGDSFSCVDDDSGVRLFKLVKPNRGHRLRLEQQYRIDCRKNVVVVENDGGNGNRGVLGKLLPLAIDQNKTVYLIEFSNAKKRKAWMKQTGFDGAMPLLTDLPKKAISHYYGGSTTNQRTGKTITAKTFVLDYDKTGWQDKESDRWKPTDVDFENDSGVYVILDRYKIVDNRDIAAAKDWNGNPSIIEPRKVITNVRDLVKILDIDKPLIYGIKKAQASKVENNPNWVNWFDYLADVIVKAGEEQGLEQSLADKNALALWRKGEFYRDNLFKLADHVEIQDGDFATIHQHIREMQKSAKKSESFDELQNILSSYQGKSTMLTECSPQWDLASYASALNAKYPMLMLIDAWDFRRDLRDESGPAWQPCIDYINLIDVSSTKSVLKGD